MRILLVQLGTVGDMVLATPIFRSLRKAYPNATIEVITSIINSPIIDDNPYINKYYVLDKSPLKLIPLFFTLRRQQYDYLIDPKDHYSSESRYIAKFINATTKIGFNPPKKHYFDLPINSAKDNKNLHLTERILLPLKHLNIHFDETDTKIEIFLSPESLIYTKEFLNKLPNRTNIMLNLSAGSFDRMWDETKWNEFLNYINRNDYNLILTFMPKHKQIAKNILSKHKLHIFTPRGLKDIISLINLSDIIITPDTAIVHIASAFNKPLLSIYTGLKYPYIKFAPLSKISETIIAEDECPHIHDITPQQLLNGFNNLITKIKMQQNSTQQ